MKKFNRITVFGIPMLLLTIFAGWDYASAHCDTMEGPVVKAARKALETGDVNHALIWVRKSDEGEIRNAFKKTISVRAIGAEARELADGYFFETLVRVHRAGEGEPYTGLKVSKRNEYAAEEQADRTLESGNADDVIDRLAEELRRGLKKRFVDANSKKTFRSSDVVSGREFVRAYVEYVHHFGGLFNLAHDGNRRDGDHGKKHGGGEGHGH